MKPWRLVANDLVVQLWFREWAAYFAVAMFTETAPLTWPEWRAFRLSDNGH